jgi:hypothetical protein
VRARHKEVSGQNLGDHGAHHRERG